MPGTSLPGSPRLGGVPGAGQAVEAGEGVGQLAKVSQVKGPPCAGTEVSSTDGRTAGRASAVTRDEDRQGCVLTPVRSKPAGRFHRAPEVSRAVIGMGLPFDQVPPWS